MLGSSFFIIWPPAIKKSISQNIRKICVSYTFQILKNYFFCSIKQSKNTLRTPTKHLSEFGVGREIQTVLSLCYFLVHWFSIYMHRTPMPYRRNRFFTIHIKDQGIIQMAKFAISPVDTVKWTLFLNGIQCRKYFSFFCLLWLKKVKKCIFNNWQQEET